jgi:hypothetical protein
MNLAETVLYAAGWTGEKRKGDGQNGILGADGCAVV